MGKDSLFNKWYWENWTATCKRIKLGYSLTPHTHKNFKWIKDLNVTHEIIKLLEENIGSTLLDTSLSMDMSPQARKTKAKIKKWNYIKLKGFCTVHETAYKMMKSSPTELEKLFAHDIFDKGYIQNIKRTHTT